MALGLCWPGCTQGSAGATRVEITPAVHLDEPIVVTFAQPLDPASITSRSVAMRRAGGKQVPVRCSVSGRSLRVLVEVDAELLARSPEHMELELAGSPSLHALRFRDGALVPHRESATIRVLPGWSAAATRPRLVEAGGRPLDGVPLELTEDRLLLVFDGRLDPATVTSRNCPLVPIQDGIRREPLWPAVSWRSVGTRFEVDVLLPHDVALAELNTRQLGFRGPGGLDVEPLAVLQMRRRE